MAVENENKEFNNPFQNKSGPQGDLNPGNRGKFSESQLAERLKVHAIAIATGSPTVAKIAEYWKERFGIDISVQSEKEWRKSNRDRIEKKKMELIDTGEIAIPVVSEAVLNDSMMDLTLSTGRLIKSIRDKAERVLRRIEIDTLGESKENDLKVKTHLRVFDILCANLHNLNKNVTDQIESMFTFAGKIKIKDKQIEKLVESEVQKKIEDFQSVDENQDIKPMDEVSDEMRERILKTKE